MAKKSQIARTKKRKVLVERFRQRRQELVATIKNPKTPVAMRDLAQQQLRKLPRDSSASRYNSRCELTGRSRGYLRKFGMSRISFRELALAGELPGVTKASW